MDRELSGVDMDHEYGGGPVKLVPDPIPGNRRAFLKAFGEKATMERSDREKWHEDPPPMDYDGSLKAAGLPYTEPPTLNLKKRETQ